LLIETSTITPGLAHTLDQECGARGLAFVDSPVSGGVKGAEEGTLTAMVGGTPHAFARAKPVLERLAANIQHLGPAGAGNMAKLIHQAVYVGYMTLYSEAVRAGKAFGLDVSVLVDVLRTSLAGEPLRLGWDRRVVDPDAAGARFPIHDAIRDLSLAATAFGDTGTASAILDSTLAVLRAAAEAGAAAQDVTAIAHPRQQ
jgi:3-hydroxyisobutyrate dehydrogenase